MPPPLPDTAARHRSDLPNLHPTTQETDMDDRRKPAAALAALVAVLAVGCGNTTTHTTPVTPIHAAPFDLHPVGAAVATIELEHWRTNATTTTTTRRATPSVAPNYDPGDGSHWDHLAQCETGGNWSTNTGNGYGGGLQFAHQRSYSTWLSFGGGEFAPHPWEASREQQIVIAERVLASSGWNAWPGCTRKLGLR